eukprot:2710096-Lingulodinium_polyedra.AAC.1
MSRAGGRSSSYRVPRVATASYLVNAIGPDALVPAAAPLGYPTERRSLVGVSEGCRRALRSSVATGRSQRSGYLSLW